MKLEFSQQIFSKYWSAKFHENPSVGADLFHADWRTWQRKRSLFKTLRALSKHTKAVLHISSWLFQVPKVFRHFAYICSTRINELLLPVLVLVTFLVYLGLMLEVFTCRKIFIFLWFKTSFLTNFLNLPTGPPVPAALKTSNNFLQRNCFVCVVPQSYVYFSLDTFVTCCKYE